MAIIHRGKNPAQETINQYYDERLQTRRANVERRAKEYKQDFEEKRAKAEASVKKNSRRHLIFLGIYVLCILILLLFPSIRNYLADALKRFCYWLAELLDNYVYELQSDRSHSPLGMVYMLCVSFLSGFVNLLLRWIGDQAIWVVCIVLFGLLISRVFAKLTDLDAEKLYIPKEKKIVFDEDAARREISAGLPVKLKIKLFGLAGEIDALKEFRRLPDDCHVFTNTIIRYAGKTSETDLIVVSPHAVTIVEVKNYKDTFEGDWADEHLLLVARRGRDTHEDIRYNPIHQVTTHAYRLENSLRLKGMNVPVNTCVFFIDCAVCLSGMTDHSGMLATCPVFVGYSDRGVGQYVRNGRAGNVAVPVDDVVRYLDELQKNPPSRLVS